MRVLSGGLPLLLLLLAACGEPPSDRVAVHRAITWRVLAPPELEPDPGANPPVAAHDASGTAPAPRRLAPEADEARRAQPLRPAAPLALELPDAPAGAELVFALGRPTQALPPAGDLTVELRERADGAAWTTRRVLLPVSSASPAWHPRRLALGAGAVELELQLLGARPGETVFVAESALRAAGREGPRVVLITSDTHRADHLGAARGEGAPLTPSLDALAARGVLFSDCFAPTNVTNPSHMSLFTGVHPRDLGIDDNTRPLDPAAETLAERFADAGFRTLAVVSARHLGHPESGLGQGFERMAWPAPEGERPAPRSLDRAARWLDDVGDEPLFLWVHLFDAHRPYRAPQRWREHYWPPGRDPADPSLPPLAVSPEVLPEKYRDVRDLDYLRALYKAEVSFLDEELGAFLAHPALAGAALAVTADHGESLGAHGIHFGHAGLFPDTLHVPLLLAWPGAPAGTRVDAAVSHADLASTLLRLGGLDAAGWPGRDLRNLADGPAARDPPRYALSAHRFSAALTHAGWHLVLQLRDEQQPMMSERFEKHAVRLFDLARDPECLHDLAEQEPERTRALRARLIDWLRAARGLHLAGSASEDREQLERLAALGYVAPSTASTSEPLWTDDACARCRRWD